jgi:hypothetical protein
LSKRKASCPILESLYRGGKMTKQPTVHVASQPNGTLYTGVTNDLVRRLGAQKRHDRSFTKKYGIDSSSTTNCTSMIEATFGRKNRSRNGVAPGREAIEKGARNGVTCAEHRGGLDGSTVCPEVIPGNEKTVWQARGWVPAPEGDRNDGMA